MDITVKIKEKISKPVAEVFEAIANPDKLATFFTTRPSEQFTAGGNIHWQLPARPAETIHITDIHFNEHIRFKWHASGSKTKVDISFKQLSVLETELHITEEAWTMDKDGVAAAMTQTALWKELTCGLKMSLHTNTKDGSAQPITTTEEKDITV